jgi:8-amino-7-oxononanoate synthase
VASKEQLPGTFFGPANLVDLLGHRARCQPDDTAFTFLTDGENEQDRLTYKELDRQARAIGAWLESLDLVGQRALLLYPPGLEFISAFFGCLYAKVVAVPVYPPRRNQLLSRLTAIVEDADAKVALTTEAVLKRVKPVMAQTSELQDLTWLATCDVPKAIERRWEPLDIRGETLAFLQYTSGSTGVPKGVMLSHANLVHNSALISHAFECTRSALGVFWLPSYHDMGLIGGILQPLYAGVPNVMMSPMAFLQRPYRWLSAISRFGATIAGGPNFAYDLCVRKITPEQREKLDLSSWKLAFNGAEPVREETITRFSETFAPCGFRREAFYPCYGLAEATLIVSGGFVNEAPKVSDVQAGALTVGRVMDADGKADKARIRRLVSSGNPLPDEKLVIADPETLSSCPDGQVGEIWVRGLSVAQGYWRKPEATKSTFKAYLEDTGEGPFLRTGDLGFLRDGELHVTGRVKDLIIVRGQNHYPQDIELTVEKSHRRLRSGCGAVFAVEMEGREQLIVVHEIHRRTNGARDEVFDGIRRAVSLEHDLAVDVIVAIKTGSIPKTSSGKIQRHACRDAWLGGTLRVVAQWSADDAIHPAPIADRSDLSDEEEEMNDAEITTAVPESAKPSPRDQHGGNGERITETKAVRGLVMDIVRRVSGSRANGLTLDTVISEMGLDSLERIEILAAIEEHFGNRFPEDILPDLQTCREVVDAVEIHLTGKEKSEAVFPADIEIPEEAHRIEQFPECVSLEKSIDMVRAMGLENPFFHVHQGVVENKTTIGGREFINYTSFSYIGMAGDPRVIKAAKDAVDKYGASASASRLVSGERDLHTDLESAIARFLGTDASVTFCSGHATNVSVIGHLFGPNDLILYDAFAHNSIVEGATLSGARRRPFAHNDFQAVDGLLRRFRRDYRRVLIAIEGVYSMDGDFPNLPEFIDVKNRHKAILMVDEAHSVGTLGIGGRGIGEQFDVDRADVELWMGTLSKALGSCGGYIAGSHDVVRYLKYTTPTFVFSVGLSPANAAAALAAIRVLEQEPERVVRLQQRSELFLSLAKRRGMNTGPSKDTPVVPIILGSSVDCLKASQVMAGRGINVRPILYPAVEESAARLRFFINSQHTEEEIRHTVDVLAEELGKIDPAHLGRPSSRRLSAVEAIDGHNSST